MEKLKINIPTDGEMEQKKPLITVSFVFLSLLKNLSWCRGVRANKQQLRPNPKHKKVY